MFFTHGVNKTLIFVCYNSLQNKTMDRRKKIAGPLLTS